MTIRVKHLLYRLNRRATALRAGARRLMNKDVIRAIPMPANRRSSHAIARERLRKRLEQHAKREEIVAAYMDHLREADDATGA